MIRLMTEHPSSVGETYVQHLVFAVRFGLSMILGGLACCLHGICPFLCTSTGSRTVLALHGRVRSRGRGGAHPIPQRSAALPPAAVEYMI